MHFTQRTYVLLMLTAVLAVVGIWSSDPSLIDLWRVPAALLLVGLAYEGFFLRRVCVTSEIETTQRAFLGREQPAAYTFQHDASRALAILYAPVGPAGVEPLGNTTREGMTPANETWKDPFSLLAVRLGMQSWPVVPARVRGPLGLAWWSRELQPSLRLAVAPDTLKRVRSRPRGNPSGAR